MNPLLFSLWTLCVSPGPLEAAPDARSVDAGQPKGSTTGSTPAPQSPPDAAAEPKAADGRPKAKLSVGAQAWLRGETRVNSDFDARQGHDSGAVLQRVRLQARGSYGPASVFVQAQDARRWGSESSTVANEANTDLHQGYFELRAERSSKNMRGYLRAGRQEISYGTMRLIGHLPWAPTARSFDAIRAHGERGRFGVDGFAAIVEQPQQFTVEETGLTVRNHGSQLYALQASFAAHDLFNLESLTLLARQRQTATAPTRDRTIINPDLHAFGASRGFFYDVEGGVQFGESDGRAHQAWAVAGFAGARAKKLRTQPGLRAGLAMASGEACSGAPEDGCGSDRSTEFFNFYPTNHIHYGLVDVAGWRNIQDVDVRALLGSGDPVTFALAYHNLALLESTGAWKNAAGNLIGVGWDPSNSSRALGNEVDITATYKPLRGLMLQGGYGVFVPASAGRRLAGPTPQHFAWLWLVFDVTYTP